jgi:hypothetical protein
VNKSRENEFTVMEIHERRFIQHLKRLRRTCLGKEVLADIKVEQLVIQLGCCDSDSSDSSSETGENASEDFSGIEDMQF